MELRFMEWKQEAIEDDMHQIEQLSIQLPHVIIYIFSIINIITIIV